MERSVLYCAKILLRVAVRDGGDPRVREEARRISPKYEISPILDKARRLSSPAPTIEERFLPIGVEVDPISCDADDVCVWIGSRLAALGYKIRFVVVEPEGQPQSRHVFVEAETAPEAWVAVDPFCAGPAGTVYPGKRYTVELGQGD